MIKIRLIFMLYKVYAFQFYAILFHDFKEIPCECHQTTNGAGEAVVICFGTRKCWNEN